MKKIFAMIITSVMVTLSVTGCGGSGAAAPTTETKPAEETQEASEDIAASDTGNSEEPVSESAYANDIPSSEYTDNVFKPLLNMEVGTAGSSLKAAQIAEEILSFAAGRQLWNTEESARKAAFSEAWNSLSSEEKELVKHNFYEEEIEKLIDGAYNDYKSVSGRFEDAGVGTEMEELTKDEGARKSWNALRELLAEAE